MHDHNKNEQTIFFTIDFNFFTFQKLLDREQCKGMKDATYLKVLPCKIQSVFNLSTHHTWICLQLPLFLLSSRVLASQLTESDLFHNSHNIIHFNCHLRKIHQPPNALCAHWVNRLTSKVTDHLLSCKRTKPGKT